MSLPTINIAAGFASVAARRAFFPLQDLALLLRHAAQGNLAPELNLREEIRRHLLLAIPHMDAGDLREINAYLSEEKELRSDDFVRLSESLLGKLALQSRPEAADTFVSLDDVVVATRMQQACPPATNGIFSRLAQPRISEPAVMFIDVRAFTANTRGWDPSKTNRFLGIYYDVFDTAVQSRGGGELVRKPMGDGLMTEFGAVTAHENDTLSALKAGRAMIDIIESDVFKQRLAAAGFPHLHIKISVHKGPCWAGYLHRYRQGDLQGDTVNEVSRMLGMTDVWGLEGSVLLASSRVLDDCQEHEGIGTIESIYRGPLAGKKTPDGQPRVGEVRLVEIYQVTGFVSSEDLPHARGAEGVPFVGRDRELRELETLYDACDREAKAQLVILSGPAGMGKTGLANQFLTHLKESEKKPVRLMIQGDPLANPPPYHSIASFIRNRAGIIPEDVGNIARQRHKLREFVMRSVGGTNEEFQRYTYTLCKILDIPPEEGPSPDWMKPYLRDRDAFRQLVLETFTAFFRPLVNDQRLVLVLEDWHWIDEGTRSLIQGLLERFKDQRFFALATSRPRSFPTNARVIEVNQLENQGLEAIVRSVLDAAYTDEVMGRLVTLSGGNTYIIEKMAMRIRDGFSVEMDASEDNIPFLQALIDVAPEEERQVLRACAVIGAVVSPAEVEAFKIRNGKDLIGSLVRRDLLVDQMDGTYRFPHDLLRVAAEKQLEDEKRRLLHRERLVYLKKIGSRKLALLAHHMAMAANGDKSMREEAARYYYEAAEEAFKISVHDAVPLYRRAIELTKDDPKKRFKYLRGLDECLYIGGLYGELEEVHQLSLKALEAMTSQDPADLAGLHHRMGRGWNRLQVNREEIRKRLEADTSGPVDETRLNQTVREEAVRYLERGREELEKALQLTEGQTSGQLGNIHCGTLIELGLNLVKRGRYQEAQPVCEGSVGLARGLKNNFLLGKALSGLVFALARIEDYPEMLKAQEEAARVYEEIGEVRKGATSLNNLGAVLTVFGAYEAGEKFLRRGYASVQQLGASSQGMGTLYNLGRILLLQAEESEDPSIKDEKLREGIKFLEMLRLRNPIHLQMVSHLVTLSELYLAIGDLENAKVIAQEAISHTDQSPEKMAVARMMGAKIAVAEERDSEALAAIEESYAILQSLGSIEDYDREIRLLYITLLKKSAHPDRFQVALAVAEAAKIKIEAMAARIDDIKIEGEVVPLRKFFLTRVRENVSLLRERQLLGLLASHAVDAASLDPLSSLPYRPRADHPLAPRLSVEMPEAIKTEEMSRDVGTVLMDRSLAQVWSAIMTHPVTVTKFLGNINKHVWLENVVVEPFRDENGKFYVKIGFRIGSTGHAAAALLTVLGEKIRREIILEDSIYVDREGSVVIALRPTRLTRVQTESGQTVEVDEKLLPDLPSQFGDIIIRLTATLDDKTIVEVTMRPRSVYSNSPWNLIDGSPRKKGQEKKDGLAAMILANTHRVV